MNSNPAPEADDYREWHALVVADYRGGGRKAQPGEPTQDETDRQLRRMTAIGAASDVWRQALGEALAATGDHFRAGNIKGPVGRYFAKTFTGRLADIPVDRAKAAAAVRRVEANNNAEEKIAALRVEAFKESAEARKAAKAAVGAAEAQRPAARRSYGPDAMVAGTNIMMASVEEMLEEYPKVKRLDLIVEVTDRHASRKNGKSGYSKAVSAKDVLDGVRVWCAERHFGPVEDQIEGPLAILNGRPATATYAAVSQKLLDGLFASWEIEVFGMLESVAW